MRVGSSEESESLTARPFNSKSTHLIFLRIDIFFEYSNKKKAQSLNSISLTKGSCKKEAQSSVH